MGPHLTGIDDLAEFEVPLFCAIEVIESFVDLPLLPNGSPSVTGSTIRRARMPDIDGGWGVSASPPRVDG